MFPCEWRPFTLHFYIEKTGKLANSFVQEFSIDNTLPSGSVQVNSLRFVQTQCEVTLENQFFLLKPANIADLLGQNTLFFIDSPRFRLENTFLLTILTPLQKSELLRVYTTIASPKLYQNLIPEPDLLNFSHEYILINHSQAGKSNSGCRNWLIQLGKDVEKHSEVSICTWNSCLAQKCSYFPEFKAADIAKTKKKLKKIVGNELCRFHQCINLIGAATKNKIGGSELWPAVLGGVLWQNKVKNSSIFGKIIGNKAGELINSFLDHRVISVNRYKSEKQLEIDKAISDPECFKKFKEKTMEEIKEFRKTKELEAAATEELRKIRDFSGNINTVILNLGSFQ